MASSCSNKKLVNFFFYVHLCHIHIKSITQKIQKASRELKGNENSPQKGQSKGSEKLKKTQWKKGQDALLCPITCSMKEFLRVNHQLYDHWPFSLFPFFFCTHFTPPPCLLILLYISLPSKLPHRRRVSAPLPSQLFFRIFYLNLKLFH